MKPSDFLTELSTEKLAQYKTAAGTDASKADKEKDFARGNKRFSGIVKATKKQFANDQKSKKPNDQGVAEGIEDNYNKNDAGIKAALQAGVKLIPIQSNNDATGKPIYIHDNSGRYTVAVDMGGISVPFYNSTGLGGKAGVAVDKWYPFFGIGPDGWINKGSEEIINDFYGSNKLKRVAQVLNNTLGLPSRAKNVSGWSVNRGDGNYFISAVNRGLDPAARSDRSTKLRDNMLSVLRGLGEPNKYVEKHTSRPKAYAFDKNNPEHVAAFDATSQSEREIASALAKDPKSQGVAEGHEKCPHCGGEMVNEELMNEKKDACYYKVKSRYKVWPSAYASGALVKCRKKGSSNWGTGGKSNESVAEARGMASVNPYVELMQSLGWFMSMNTATIQQDAVDSMAQQELKSMQQQFRKPIINGKSFADVIGDPTMFKHPKVAPVLLKFAYDILGYIEPRIKKYIRPELQAKWMASISKLKDQYRAAIQFTSGQQGVAEDQLDEKWSQKYKSSINCSNPKGFSQKAHCAGKQKNESSILEGIEQVDENLHQWFKEKWVRFGPDGKIRGDCARGDDSEGKPKCLPQSKAQNLGKKARASAAARKRREDPNPERSGKAINVNTKKKSNEGVAEGSGEKEYIVIASMGENDYELEFRAKTPEGALMQAKKWQKQNHIREVHFTVKEKGVTEEQLDELSCWSGYTRVQGIPAGAPGSCKKKTKG